jgi:electron transport complex protein RnfB
MSTVDAIDALLPQTQCGECSFAGCRPYAEALHAGTTSIDKCPPGGVMTMQALAALLDIDAEPYRQTVAAHTRPPALAIIQEEECIGCTKCIAACPVDAIIGSAKVMHSIIATECTGCGLCVAPCPVDCIELLPLDTPTYDKNKARARFSARQQREEKAPGYASPTAVAIAKKDYIAEALARVAAKKNG